MTNANIEMMMTVARGLRELKEKVAFCGGGTVSLYITDAAAPETRVSDDVDCVIELSGLINYHKLEEQLKELGFQHPPINEDSPVCRWIFCGIKVDIMPTDESILGFANLWYKEALKNLRLIKLPDDQTIKIFTLPFFLATKIEAFNNRGKGDYYGSRDLEDIVGVIDGCSENEIQSEVEKAPDSLKNYLNDQFQRLLNERGFVESIEGHVSERARAEITQRKIEKIFKN